MNLITHWSYNYDSADLADLVGRTLTLIHQQNDDQLYFQTTDGDVYCLHHDQECCEHVTIEDITGNLDDLIGSPILRAYSSSNKDNSPESKQEDSHTWTFYNFTTAKGHVTIRWYGESNGYYSEEVDFVKIRKENGDG